MDSDELLMELFDAGVLDQAEVYEALGLDYDDDVEDGFVCDGCGEFFGSDESDVAAHVMECDGF